LIYEEGQPLTSAIQYGGWRASIKHFY